MNNWKVGKHHSVVVSTERTPRFDGIEKYACEIYELKNYGGYIIAESISSLKDSLCIAAAPDLLNACKAFIFSIDEHDKDAFFNSISLAREAIKKAEPPALLIGESAAAHKLMKAEALIKMMQDDFKHSLDMSESRWGKLINEYFDK